MSGSNLSIPQKLLRALVLLLLLSAAYLYPFPQANILYPGVVLIHAFVGVVAAVLMLFLLWPLLRDGNFVWKSGWVLLTAGAILGLVLFRTGTAHSEFKWLYAHIIMSVAGISCLLAEWMGKRNWVSSNAAIRLLACVAALAGIGWAARYQRETRWLSYYLIKNPTLPPATMDAEGDGPQGPFFPSSAQVYGGQKIPSKFFMESESCKRCHEDIYKQWYSSAHHFSSFNNQWYRKSIEYMQNVVGTKPSKWCGGCHDPAVLDSRVQRVRQLAGKRSVRARCEVFLLPRQAAAVRGLSHASRAVEGFWERGRQGSLASLSGCEYRASNRE